MVKLPKRIRNILDLLVSDLKSRESISGVGLFGSWSRGDAVLSSDIDLLVVDRKDFDYEYVERIEINNALIDLNYIPEKWILRGVPPQVDQKLYEIQVLYDRNWLLTNTKEWMRKTYWRHERVDIRTENYLIEADTYLSRATSAYHRGDIQSASVYASIGLKSILKILIEVNMLPLSNSHFIEALKASADNLGMAEIFTEYVRIAKLGSSKGEIEERVDSLNTIWNEAISFTEKHKSILKTLHIKVRNNLNYYMKSSFLKGMIERTKTLIDTERFLEASNYMLYPLIDMLENYSWLKSAVTRTRFDYTRLFQSMKGSEESPTSLYLKSIKVAGLEKLTKEEAKKSLTKAKEIALNIRRERKDLIRENIKEPK